MSSVQERIQLLGFIEQILPTLPDHALYAIGLACTSLANSDEGEAETPRETFDAILDMLNTPSSRALGTIACAIANAQAAAQRSDDGMIGRIMERVRRSQA